MRYAWPILIAAILLVGHNSALASDGHVRAMLLADVSTAAPGQPFVVGVLLDLDPEWHVYWKNPGDSGAPTLVKFTAPEGWRVGDLQYPVPAQIPQPGDFIVNGYERQVLLIATISPSEQTKVGQPVTISANVSWLVCKDVCLPGSTKLELKIPTANRAISANADIFAPWLARIPTPAKDTKDIESLAVEGELFADGSTAPFVIDVRTHHPWKDAQWFPAADRALAVESPHVQSDADHVGVSFQARVLQGQKFSPTTMPSVLAYTDETGQRRGVVIDVPLKIESPTTQ